MAGPYHTAQSPEPLPIPSSSRHSWTFLSALSLTIPRLSRFNPTPILLDQSPRSLPAATPPSNRPSVPYHSVRPATIDRIPKSLLLSGAVLTSDIPFRTARPLPLPEISIPRRISSHQTALVLSVLNSLHQTAATNRHSPPPKLSGSQHLICFILLSIPAFQTAFW
jgi:hypothetical protein